MNTKMRSMCKRVLGIDKFNKNNSRPDRLQAFCRGCNIAYLKEHYSKNKKYY